MVHSVCCHCLARPLLCVLALCWIFTSAWRYCCPAQFQAKQLQRSMYTILVPKSWQVPCLHFLFFVTVYLYLFIVYQKLLPFHCSFLNFSSSLCWRFFATSTSLAPSSNNTLSTMLHEAAQKQCNDLDTVASGHYQPPVSATKSAATVSRFKPKALSSSWHSGQKESEEDKKKKAGTGSGAGTLSMFMYSGKRKSSEVNELPLAAESPCSPDIDNPQPSAKIARPNAGRDAHALSGVDVNTEYTSAHSPLPLGSDLSPIVTGNLHSCSARLDAARGVENIPPGSQLSDMQESPLSSTPARSNLPYKLVSWDLLFSFLFRFACLLKDLTQLPMIYHNNITINHRK